MKCEDVAIGTGSHRTMSAAQVDSTVILRRGRSSKARFNGTTAWVRPQDGAGGWVSVSVGGQVVKWRSGHWESASQVPECVLLSMPSELIASVLSKLELHDVLTCMKAAKIFRTAIRVPATWADADFLCIPQGRRVHFAKFLADVGADLRHLRVRVGRKEHGILASLIHACGSALHAAHVHLLPDEYWLQLPVASATPVDVDDPVPLTSLLPPLPPVLQSPGADVATSCTALEGCGSIHLLRITESCDIFSPYDTPVLWSQQPRLTSVRMLEVTVLEGAAVQSAISGLPALEHLVVCVGYSQPLELSHPTLRVVDMRRSQKHSRVDRLECPKLEQLMCGRYHAYGNGVLLINPHTNRLYDLHGHDEDEDPNWYNQAREQYRYAEPPCVQFAPMRYHSDEMTLLEIPVGCEVSCSWCRGPLPRSSPARAHRWLSCTRSCALSKRSRTLPDACPGRWWRISSKRPSLTCRRNESSLPPPILSGTLVDSSTRRTQGATSPNISDE